MLRLISMNCTLQSLRCLLLASTLEAMSPPFEFTSLKRKCPPLLIGVVTSTRSEASTNLYGGNLVSNPFFVLRCARKAFSKCTFLLSCLRTSDPCAVNVSENGSFQHYQGSDNQAYHEVSVFMYEITLCLSCSGRISLSALPFRLSLGLRGISVLLLAVWEQPSVLSEAQSSRSSPQRRMHLSSVPRVTHRVDNDGKLVFRIKPTKNGFGAGTFSDSNHVSWEMEENPPIESPDANETRNSILAHMNTSSGSYAPKGWER